MSFGYRVIPIICNRFIKSNIDGVRNLLEIIDCTLSSYDKPLFFQISTDEVYGDIEEGQFDENSSLNPSNPYAATKAAADLLIQSVSAASIIAKVERDKYMIKLDQKYPQYNLKKNKGYPTREHLELLNRYGVNEIYRLSFKPVKELVNKKNT